MVRSAYIDENGMRKGAWSKEEDNKLKAYINKYGHWNWRELPKYAGLFRCGKSCRLRWLNYLHPNTKRGSYTKEEEDIIMKLHDQLGKKWSVIAKQLPGRTDNEVKNYWHAHLKKRKKPLQNPILSSSKEMGESSSGTCQFEGNQEISGNQSSQILKEKINQEIERESLSYNIPSDHKESTRSREGLTSSEASSSCSELSLSYSDVPLSDLMTWVGEGSFPNSFESLANFMSPPLTDPEFLYPPSPIIEEEFLWSYHLGDESNNW